MAPSEQPREIRQASCVAVGGRALLIEGHPGSGKSSLALTLMDRGAVLISDDAVTLSQNQSGVLIASPAPNIEGLLEVRGVGLLRFATTSAPLALVIRLDDNAPRYIEKVAMCDRAGAKVPFLSLYPDGYILPLRAEQALRIHGLKFGAVP